MGVERSGDPDTHTIVVVIRNDSDVTNQRWTIKFVFLI